MLNLPPEQDPRHPVIIAVGGFVIGVVLTSAWFLDAKLPHAGVSDDPGAAIEATTTQSAPSALVSVHNQAAGSDVVVDSVNVPAPGVWVAVEELHSGELGNVLGASRTLAPTNAVDVTLVRPTIPSTTYAVVLYRDNGDGDFNHLTDSVYVDFATGERVVALFTTL
jgi:hypothetical protein